MKIKLIKPLSEGQQFDRWYLPIRRYTDKFSVEQVFFLLAIPYLFLLIIKNILFSIWKDLIEFSFLLEHKRRQNEKKGKI